MKLLKDAFTGDELLSDSFPIKEVDGVLYECDCAMIELGNVNVDTGANASAEEAAEDLDDSVQKVNNITHSFSYQSTSYDKASYLSYMKKYMKAVVQKMTEKGESPEAIKTFQTQAQTKVKQILGKIKDYDFYMGPGDDAGEGMVILLNYREDGVTPYVTLWKHGLVEEKV